MIRTMLKLAQLTKKVIILNMALAPLSCAQSLQHHVFLEESFFGLLKLTLIIDSIRFHRKYKVRVHKFYYKIS